MKKFFTAILLCLIWISGFAQAQVTIVSKKDRLSDITMKTIKVVLPGEDYISLSLREAVKNAWSLSPYEFCGMGEFEKLKNASDNYFMVMRNSEGKKDDGIRYLSIVKSGNKELSEIVAMPLCAADTPTGREAAFMPAIIAVMQNYIDKSLIDGFKDIKTMIDKAPKNSAIMFDNLDIAEQVSPKVREKQLKDKIHPSDKVGDAILYGLADTIVGYAIYPCKCSDNSVCYKLAFDARTHQLYYMEKHKISSGKGKGFLKSDISKLTAGR